MAQMTNSLAQAILDGAGVTRHELEQLARYWLTTQGQEWHEFRLWQEIRKRMAQRDTALAADNAENLDDQAIQR